MRTEVGILDFGQTKSMQVGVGTYDNKVQDHTCTAQSDASRNDVSVRHILMKSTVP